MISTYGLLMSMNDPGWGRDKNSGDNQGGGKRPNPGPPDLDELWQDFNRRLAGMFGGKGGGESGGRPPNLDPGRFSSLILLVLVGMLLAWLATGIYIVDAPQRAVVMQFGRFHEITGPGLHWRFPKPVQSHVIVELTTVRSVEIGYRGTDKNKILKEALMLTDDENIIDIQFAIQYSLKDPKAFLFENRDPAEAVTQAAESAIREVVGKSKMDFLLYGGREEVAANTQKVLQDILDRYNTGILISKVTMQNAQPPEQVQAAFSDAIKAGQDRERQINEGQAYANDVVPRAEGTKSRLMEEAAGYKQRMIATAEGDASRFTQLFTEYAKAPEVTRQRLYLETMQQVYSKTSKIMIDAKSAGNLLYLPLDKLMQATAAGTQPASNNPLPAANETRSAAPSPSRTPRISNESPPQVDVVPPVGMSGMSGSSLSRSRDESLRTRDSR